MQMYKYGLAFDIDIFESLSLSFSEGLKEKVVNRLCLQTIDYSVIVADLNWLKFTIQSITDAYEYSFERWFNALNMKYNPIENYDRFEEFDTNSSANSQVGTSSHTEGTDLNSVNAYDKIELVPESSVYNNSNSNISSESGVPVQKIEKEEFMVTLVLLLLNRCLNRNSRSGTTILLT